MSLASKAAAFLRPRTSNVRIGPIGVDFSLESLHMVQLESIDGRAPTVRARASLAFDRSRRELLDNPLQFRALIRRAIASDRFHGRSAIIAIPSVMFRTMSINYQLAQNNKNEAATIIQIIRDRLDGDLSDYVIDYLPVKTSSKSDERLALVAVSERAEIINFLELTRKAGLDADALEIGPVAISRLVGALSLERGQHNVLVINSGRRASYLTLISGTDLLFDQDVPVGEDGLLQQAAVTLDMSEDMVRDLVLQAGIHAGARGDVTAADDEDAVLVRTVSEVIKPLFMKLVEEIKRVCLYAAAETRGGAVTQIYLLGSIARWPGSDALLSELSGTQVAKIPDPLALFPAETPTESNRVATATPEIAVATGAALRGMTGDE